MTTTPTSGAAIQRYKIGYHADEWGQRSSTPSGIPDASGSWVRYADHVNALAAGQATAAQAVAEPADTVVLEAALRAIHQAIDLIGEPDTERLRTVRRVLRGAVIVAEDAGEAATAHQPAPAPLSEPIDQLERELAIIGVVGAIDGHDVVRRESVLEIARRAALAAQGGKDA